MFYTEELARKLVIIAGHELIEKKLIARTWGNISARISKTEFVITPSGRAYDTLKESDLVIVKVSDLSYIGNIKPSSEKGIHAEIYKLRENVNFIIHTHQDYATAISVDKNDYAFTYVAKYGLPGTKKLRNNVSKIIKEHEKCNSFLMERHGVICFGCSIEEAFTNVIELENKSKEYYDGHHVNKDINLLIKPYLDDYAQMYGFGNDCVETEDIEAAELIKKKNFLAGNFSANIRPMNIFDCLLQHFIYKNKYSKLKNK